MDGLGALIISPTRELAFQTFEVLKRIGNRHDFSAGNSVGEEKCSNGSDIKI
jgi:ATP-dependent RNA helicase DDX10/DBP4